MKLPRFSGRLPLLTKELVEQAARARTYLLRLTFAVVLFVVCGFWLYDRFYLSANDLSAILGQGADLFNYAFGTQLAAVFLLLPAMTAGVITSERENNTLLLLVMTDLRPWEILIQKGASRLIPLVSFLLLAMPIAAVAYMIGGVENEKVLISTYALILTAVQIAAIVTLISTFCRRTVASLLVCYLAGPFIYMGVLVANLVVACIFGIPLALMMGGDFFDTFEHALVAAVWPPLLMFDMGSAGVGHVVLFSAPIWVVTGLMTLMARDELNAQRVAGNYTDREPVSAAAEYGAASRRERKLPDDAPIAWYRTRARAHQPYVRLSAAAVCGALILWMYSVSLVSYRAGGAGALDAMILLGWVLATLVLAVMASGLFPTERASQTLDVLLTAPLPGDEMLRQMMTPLRRWARLIGGVMLLMVVLKATVLEDGGFVYLLLATTSIIVFLNLVVWLSLLVGFLVRKQAKAVLWAVLLVVGWQLGVAGVAALIEFFWRGGADVLHLLTPALLIEAIESSSALRSRPVVAVCVLAIYGALAFGLRAYCLRRIDRLMGRSTPGGRPIETARLDPTTH